MWIGRYSDEVLPEKLDAAKYAIFPTLFITWPKIRYPIQDVTLKSISCFEPVLQLVLKVQTNV